MTTILYLIRNHWLAFGLFTLASAVTLFFLSRAVMTMVFFNDPRHQDQEIAGWMTPRYVSMSYRLPREKTLRALELTPGEAPGITLRKLAEARGTTVQALAETLLEAVQDHRAEQAHPGTPPTGPRDD